MRSPLTISESTKLSFAVGTAISIAASLLYVGWKANDSLRDIKEELSSLRTEVRQSWSLRDMKDYSAEVQSMNSASGFKTPDASNIHRYNRLP